MPSVRSSQIPAFESPQNIHISLQYKARPYRDGRSRDGQARNDREGPLTASGVRFQAVPSSGRRTRQPVAILVATRTPPFATWRRWLEPLSRAAAQNHGAQRAVTLRWSGQKRSQKLGLDAPIRSGALATASEPSIQVSTPSCGQ